MAIPGKVIKLNENSVIVDYGEEKREVGVLIGAYKVGKIKSKFINE